jgi:hypothetical protein
MKQFKDFGITAPAPAFAGDKIKMSKILNKQIIIHRYKIEDSKFKDKGNGKRLDMQIELKGTNYIVWTSSVVLQETIKQIPAENFPFTTTIVLENERYEFT